MIILDIAAPIFLLFGLNATTAANASLLNNFEIVATAIIALVVFKEKISVRLWIGILFVTLSCGILSFEDISSLQFSYGSILVLLAAVCWGFENNCTRKISTKDPMQIDITKRYIFRHGFYYYWLVHWRTDRSALEYYRCSCDWFCSLWSEHLFLCICAEVTRRSTYECLLCCCAVYSVYPFNHHF